MLPCRRETLMKGNEAQLFPLLFPRFLSSSLFCSSLDSRLSSITTVLGMTFEVSSIEFPPQGLNLMRARERSTSLSSCPSHSSRVQRQLEAASLSARPRSSARTSSIEIRSSTSSPSWLPSRPDPLAAHTSSTVHRSSRCFSASNHRWATPSPQLRLDTKPCSAMSMSTLRVHEATLSLSAGHVLTATAPLRPQSDPTATNAIASTDNADLRSRSETPKSAPRSRMATEPIMSSVKRYGGYREIGVLKSIDSQPVFLHRPSSMAQSPPPPSGKLSIAVQTEGQGVYVYAHHLCLEPNADLLILRAGKVGRTELPTSETSSMENSMDDCPNEASISVAVRTIVGARPSFATVADDYRDSPPRTSPPQQPMLLSSRSSPQLRRDSTARSETASAKARTANVAAATSSPDRHDRSLTSNTATAEERQDTRNAPGEESGARPYHQRLGPHFGIQTPLLAPLQTNYGSERSRNVEVTHSSGPSVNEMAERKGWQRSIDAAYTIATAALDGTSSRCRTESSKSYTKEVQVFEAMPKVGPNVEVMPGPVVSSQSTWQKIEEEGATQEVKHVAAAHGRNRSMSYHPTNSSRPAPNVPALLTDLPSTLVTYEAPPRLLQGLPTQPERSVFWTPPRVSRFHSTTATRLYTAPHGAKQISHSQSPQQQQQQQQQVSTTSVSRRRQGAIWGDERAHRHHVSVPLVPKGEAATEGIECNSRSQLSRATQKRNEKLVQTIPAASADSEADHVGEQDRFVHIQRIEGGPAAGVRAPSPSSKSVRTPKLSTAKSFSSVVRSALFRTPRRNKGGNDDGRSSSSAQEGKLSPSQATPMFSRHGSDQNLSGDTVIYQGPQMSTASFSSRRSSLGKETDTSSIRSVLSAAMRRSSVDKDNAALAHKGPTTATGYASMQHPPSANKVFSALKGSRLKSRASGVSFNDSSDSLLLANSTMMSSSSGGPSGITACSTIGRPPSPHSSSSQSAPSEEFSPVGVLSAAAAAAPHQHSLPGANLRQHKAALSILTHSGSTQIAERALESSTSLLSLKRTKRSGPPLQAPSHESPLYTPRRAQGAVPSSPLFTPLMSTTNSTMEKSVSFALDNTVVFELQPDPSTTETTPRGSGSYPRGMGPSVPIVQNRRSSGGAKSYSSTSSATTHSSSNAVPAGALPNGSGGLAKQPSTGVNQLRPSVFASSRTSTSTSASTSTSSSARPTLPPTPQTTSREREREREKKGPNVKPPSMYLQAHLDVYKGTMPLPGSDEEDSDFEDEDRRVNFAGLGVSGLWTSNKKKAEAEKRRRKSNGSFSFPKSDNGDEEVEDRENNEGEGVVRLDDIVASGPKHKGSRKR